MRYNLSGKTFGSLTVREPEGRDARRHMVWLCDCTCGKTHSLCAHDIIRNTSQTCTRSASSTKAKAIKTISQKDKDTIDLYHRELTAFIRANKIVLEHFKTTGIQGIEIITRDKQAVPILDMTEAYNFIVGLIPLLVHFAKVHKDYADSWPRMYSLAPESVPVRKHKQALKPIKDYCRVKPLMFTARKYPRWQDVEIGGE